MIRVISGKYRHREIYQPKTMEVRPTMDVVRSAIFSALSNINGTHVLDVFSGSGAFGIESISRGADNVVFIDKLPICLACIKKTCDKFLIDSKNYKLIKGDYNNIMNSLKQKFDLIFADPPYKMRIIKSFFDIITKNDLINCGGKIIYETVEELIDIEGFSLKRYNYGQKNVGIYCKL